jgi:hypothetical protein
MMARNAAWKNENGITEVQGDILMMTDLDTGTHPKGS